MNSVSSFVQTTPFSLVKMQIQAATAWQKKRSVVFLVTAVIVSVIFGSVSADGSIKLSDYSRYDDSPINSYNSDDSESVNNNNDNLIRKRRYDGAQVWRILVEDDKQKQAIQEMEERFGEDFLFSFYLFFFRHLL